MVELSGFPVGAPNAQFAKYFEGTSYLAQLTKEPFKMFNVTFEPGCHNNWHIHHAESGGGQMLICVCGEGYYQLEGDLPRTISEGEVVTIPAGVKHWHGAAPNKWFQHLSIELPGEACSTEWCEPVSKDIYGKLE